MRRFQRRQLPKSILANQVFFAPLQEIQGGKVVVPTHFPVLGDVTGAVMSGFGGIYFPGAGSYVSVADSDDSKYLGSTTISVWAKVDSVGAYRGIVSKFTPGTATNIPLDIRTHPSGAVEIVVAGPANYYIVGGGSVVAGGWAHYAVTLQQMINGQSHLYINASEVSLSYVEGTPASENRTGSGAVVRIGQREDGSTVMDGSMKNLRIFNRHLMPAEIERVMNFDNPL